jgi:dihydroxyacetone kinase-like predicted kinase
MDHKMTTVSKTKLDSIKDLFDNIVDLDEKEVVTILYGVDVTEEELNDIISYLEYTYPFLEVGAISGGQKVYSFIISVE